MKGSKSDLSVQAVIYMSILAFQFGSQPVLTKLFVSPSVCKTSIVIAQEICKFVISFLMLFANGSWPKVVSGKQFLLLLYYLLLATRRQDKTKTKNVAGQFIYEIASLFHH